MNEITGKMGRKVLVCAFLMEPSSHLCCVGHSEQQCRVGGTRWSDGFCPPGTSTWGHDNNVYGVFSSHKMFSRMSVCLF